MLGKKEMAFMVPLSNYRQISTFFLNESYYSYYSNIYCSVLTVLSFCKHQ